MATQRLLLTRGTIRLAEPKDAEAVAYIRQTTWRATYTGLIDNKHFENFDLEKETERNRRVFAEKQVCWVIEQQGKLVGFFFVNEWECEFNGHSLEANVGAIYVLPEAQRQGLGGQAFDWIRAHLKAKNKKTFSVFCLKTNVRGRSFYEKQGGKLIGEKCFGDLLEVCYRFEIE